ncbi:MAG: SRPBCC family protein [Bdellovibrionales bacterium]
MFKKIFIGLVVIVGLVLVYAAIQPAQYVVSREVLISAPIDKVFPFVSKRTLSNSWNPWLKKDTQAKITTEGPESGIGSATLWTDGKELGTGKATVIGAVPNERVVVKIDYEKPFVMTQEATVLLAPEGTQTKVIWKVEGENTFMGRVMCIFMNMDKMVGGVFEEGLGELKTMVETAG